jgi:hypothetical protein
MFFISKKIALFISYIFIVAVPCFAGGNAYEIDMTKLNWEEQTMFASLQGIVNRSGPNVFVRYNDADDHWASYYGTKYSITFTKLSDPYQLIKICSNQIKGYVVWDYDNIDEINVATTLAGLNDWIVVSPLLKDRVDSLGIPQKEDLRNNFTGMTKAQVYTRSFNNYFSGCSKRYITSLPTGNVNWVNVDISSYVNGDSVYVRFEDAVKSDGNGAKLRCLEVLNNGNEVAYFQVGSKEEAKYIYDADGSWFDADGDRIADATQYFTYKFKIANAGKVTLKFLAFNQYMVKVGGSSIPTSTVSYETTVIGSTIGSNAERDMAVFYKTFCFDLSSHQSQYPEEYAVKEKIMEATDHPSIELGWVSYQTGRDDEGAYVTQASIHGNTVICSGAPNFSFHVWMKPAKITPPAVLPTPQIDTSKVYVSFLLSDGDALHWDNGLQGRDWLSNLRGSIPFGWELQPLLYDLAPGMLQYYYETATYKDDFAAAASGIGYCHPEEFPSDRLDTYLKETKYYMQQSGLKTISILSSSNIPFEVASKYRANFKELGINCVEGYGGRLAGGYPFTDFIVWRTQAPMSGLSRDTILLELNNIAGTRQSGPLFVPVHPICYNAGFDDIKWVVNNLDPNKFVVVTPGQLLRMVSKYYSGEFILNKPDGFIPMLNGSLILPVEFRDVTDNPVNVDVQLDMTSGGKTISKINHAQARQDIMSRAEFQLNSSDYPVSTDSLKNATLNFSSGSFNKTYTYPVVKLDYTPSAGMYCTFEDAWDASGLSHRFGQKVSDADAAGGEAWYAAKNAAGAPGHIVYGPYATLPAGYYIACFRLKVDALTSSEIADLDVFDNDVSSTIPLAEKQIKGSDFVAAGKYRFIYLTFHHNGIGSIETRIFFTGAAGIWVDEIVVIQQQKIGSITGEQQGHISDTLSFSVRAFDPNNDSLSIRFSWGDKDTSSWTAFYPSGSAAALSHSWNAPGNYPVRYQTRNIKSVISSWSDSVLVTISGVSGIKNDNIKINKYSLEQNYPNPFNPSTVISWQLSSGSFVRLKIYDILGNEVASLVNEYQNAGTHSIIFNTQQTASGKHLSSGIYFYRLQAGSYTAVKKLVLLK